MNTEKVKVWVKMSEEYFVLNWGVWEVCSLQQKCSSLLGFGEGTHKRKKISSKLTICRGNRRAEIWYQAGPCAGVEELVGLPSLHGLVRWSVSYKLPNLFLPMSYR